LLVRCSFVCSLVFYCFFFSSRRRHTRSKRDWSSDVCSSDLSTFPVLPTAIVDSNLRAGFQPRTGSEGRAGFQLRAGSLARDSAQIGRASCRERVEIAVGAGSLERKKVKSGTREGGRRQARTE